MALTGTQTYATASDANGYYNISGVTANGSYTVTASKAGYNLSGGQTFNNVTSNQTANFTAALAQYVLTTAVNPSGAGTVTAGGTHAYGSTVTLSAAAASGYQFSNFSGSANGISNPFTVTISGPMTVTANFTANPSVQQQITTSPITGLQLTLGGQGCSSPCTTSMAPGNSYQISAVSPQAVGSNQYVFSSWSDGGSQTHTVTTGSAPRTILANYVVSGVLTITSQNLPSGSAQVPYSQTLSATGGTAPYTWAVASGAPPPGLNLGANGVLSGMPSAAGTYNFAVRVTDHANLTANKSLTLSVSNPSIPMTINTSSLPGGTVGWLYSQTFAASGGAPPYSWTVASGSLPAGLSLSSTGVLSGTPALANSYGFGISAADSAGHIATQAFSVTVINSTTQYTISGTVATAGSNTALAGATVVLAGSTTTSVQTAADGIYSFSVPAGTYTVNAGLQGYSFNPGTWTTNSLNSSQPGVNFSGGPRAMGRVPASSGTPAYCSKTSADVLNDGTTQTFAYCIGYIDTTNTFHCSPYENASRTSGFSVSGEGVTATFLRSPSQCATGLASSYDLSFTAALNAAPTSRDLSYYYDDGYWGLGFIKQAGALHIYDATPRVDTVDASQNPVVISGSNFGASGAVVVCGLETSSSPCPQTPDIKVGTVLWGSTVISAVLTPQVLTAGSNYCIQVQSNGASGSAFVGVPDGSSTPVSICNPLNLTAVTLTPTDVSGNPGDVFAFTASGFGGTGSYTWSIGGGTQPGDDVGAFQFVSSSCVSGASCPAITPDPCVGGQSCTAYVQAKTTGFANLGVAFQTSSANSPPQSARLRAITMQITKIWSDQFPDGPVANYLPGDGTPDSGAGAGLVGNARQLLIAGVRDSRNGDASPVDGWKGYIKGLVTTSPAGVEALSHVLVGAAPGSPPVAPAGGSWATLGLNTTPGGVGGVTTSGVFSVAIEQTLTATDYTVVAGVNRNAATNQVTDTLTASGTSTWFYRPCAVTLADPSPCSNGAVRIISRAENDGFVLLAQAGGVFSSDLLPTATDHLIAFVKGQAPSLLASPAPTSPNSNINTAELLFNTGLVFAAGTSPYGGPIYEYQYAKESNHADRIRADSDFQSLIVETVALHKAEILAHFSGLPGGTNFTFPAWQAIGCTSATKAGFVGNCLPGGRTEFGDTPAEKADRPALFPCSAGPGALPAGVTSASLSGKECDLSFTTLTNLNYAFGRTGYNFTVIANVSSVDSSHFLLNNVSLSGYLYDAYQWNPVFGGLLNLDKRLSNLQAASNAAGRVGQVFRIKVTLDTSNPIVLPYAF